MQSKRGKCSFQHEDFVQRSENLNGKFLSLENTFILQDKSTQSRSGERAVVLESTLMMYLGGDDKGLEKEKSTK